MCLVERSFPPSVLLARANRVGVGFFCHAIEHARAAVLLDRNNTALIGSIVQRARKALRRASWPGLTRAASRRKTRTSAARRGLSPTGSQS